VDVGQSRAAYWLIMAAAWAGKLSPDGAVSWARRAARGESVAVLASLAPAPEESRQVWAAQAVSTDLASRVLSILMQAVGALADGGADEFGALFPPHDPLGGLMPLEDGPLIYDAPDEQGRRPASRSAYAARPDPRPFAASPPVEDLADEDLHRLLFGDTTGDPAA
jgi:hypothetical protein